MFNAIDYLWLIPVLPLLASVLIAFLGPRLLREHSHWPCVLGSVGACVLSFLVFFAVRQAPDVGHLEAYYTWFRAGAVDVSFALRADALTAIMLVTVTFIGSLIAIYSIGYMHDDNSYWRFFTFLNLFTFAMLLLVTGDNLLLMFVGWEGVGLCSYALIGFWYQDHVNTTAGNKAFIVNRVGDFGFILGIFLIFWTLDHQGHGTVSFREIQKFASLLKDQEIWGVGVATLATLFLFIGATEISMELIDGFDQRALFQGRKRIGLGAFARTIVYDCDARLDRESRRRLRHR